MSTIANLMITIGADTAAAVAAMKGLHTTTQGVVKGLEGAGKVLSGVGGIASTAFNIAEKGALMYKASLTSAFGVLKDGMAGINAWEDATAQMNAVLKSTGGVAGMTADELTKMASAYQLTTKYAEENVLAGENMLLTFTNIGKDVFPQATAAMLDMATAMGGDPVSTAMQLGKALNDPINGLTALRRVGVAFTDQQQEQIKAMVEAGNVAEAQKMILQELQKEFGGSAEAAGKTFRGQLVILKNSLGEVAESVVGKFLPSIQLATQTMIDAAPAFGSAIMDLFSGVDVEAAGQRVQDSIAKVVGAWFNVIFEALPGYMASFNAVLLGAFKGIMDQLPRVVKDIGPAILTNFFALFNGITKMIVDNAPLLTQAAIECFFGILDGLTETFTIIADALPDYIAGLADYLSNNMDKFVTSGMNFMLALLRGISENIPVVVDAFLELMPQIQQALVDNLGTLVEAGIELIVAVVVGIAEAAPQLVEAIIAVLPQIIQAIIENLPALVDAGIKIIVALILGIAQASDLLIPAILQSIWIVLKELGNHSTELLNAGMTLILKVAEGIIEEGFKVVGAIGKVIGDALKEHADNLGKWFQGGIDIIKNIIKGIGQQIEEFKTNARAALDNALKAMTEGLWQFGQLGANIVKGIWTGIVNMGNWLWERVKGFFSNIVKWAMDVLGMHSPSTVFRDKVGRNIVRGIGEGFLSEMGGLESTIKGSLAGLSAMASGSMTIGGAISAGVAAAPSEAPYIGGGNGGGYKEANIIIEVDGRTLIKVLGQELVDEIRLRTGIRI